MKTTLNKIRAKKPCISGWIKLLKHLGKTNPDDEPLSIITILDSNGIDDAFWCLRAVDGHDKEIRLLAVKCAREVQYLMMDEHGINALDVSERFANGQATVGELAAVRDLTYAAAYAGASAGVAARGAAWDAAWGAAYAVAYVAAYVAADAAANAAANAAAYDSARNRQADLLRQMCEKVEP